MFGLSTGELVVTLLIFLLIFGAARLPDLGKNLALGMRSFRDALKGTDEGQPLKPQEPQAPPKQKPSNTAD